MLLTNGGYNEAVVAHCSARSVVALLNSWQTMKEQETAAIVNGMVMVAVMVAMKKTDVWKVFKL